MNSIAQAPQSILANASLLIIRFYRAYLSRYKPGSCAYGRARKGSTCSTYALHIFSTESFSSSVVLMAERFQKCNYAAQQLNLDKTYSCFGLLTGACCCYTMGVAAGEHAADKNQNR